MEELYWRIPKPFPFSPSLKKIPSSPPPFSSYYLHFFLNKETVPALMLQGAGNGRDLG